MSRLERCQAWAARAGRRILHGPRRGAEDAGHARTDRPRSGPDRARSGTLAALALSLVLAGTLGEGLARLVGPRFAEGVWTCEYHPLLGFAPQPGSRSRPHAPWHANIDEDGLRSNGGARPAGVPILAVGNSFTFGEEVEDGEAWPAFLERELRVPVLNGGVPSYGFDQTVLRAELLLGSRRVRAVVVSLIFDDLRRCQCSALSGWPKSYFDASGGRLELRNAPVPRPLATRPFFGVLARHSRLLAWIRHAINPAERKEHGRGREVGRLLVERLGAEARRGPPVLLLLQGPVAAPRGAWPRFHNVARPALRELEQTAARSGLPTLNLVEAAWEEVRRRPSRRAELYLHGGAGHMTPAGNAWVAARVARKLQALGWVVGS